MSEDINRAKLYWDFWQRMNFDPQQAEVIEAFLTGQKPYLPTDSEMRRRYLLAANRVLTAPETEREILAKAVLDVRAISYTDKDFACADYVVKDAT